MWLGIGIAAAAIAVGTVIGLIMAKKNRALFENGTANRKRQRDFYLQAHTFKTVVPDLNTLLTALDLNVFRGQGIEISKDADSSRLVFRNAAGTMAASVSTLGDNSDGIYRYTFKMNTWKEHNGVMANSAWMDSNIILTALEKAFLTLDFNAVVERVYLTDWKTKASFI